jgi:hypothetical protein
VQTGLDALGIRLAYIARHGRTGYIPLIRSVISLKKYLHHPPWHLAKR